MWKLIIVYIFPPPPHQPPHKKGKKGKIGKLDHFEAFLWGGYCEVGEGKILYSQNIYFNELPQKKIGLYP